MHTHTEIRAGENASAVAGGVIGSLLGLVVLIVIVVIIVVFVVNKRRPLKNEGMHMCLYDQLYTVPLIWMF